MAAYNEYHLNPDLDAEQNTMSRGRLIKARFPSLDGANVRWFWIATGNCSACVFNQPARSQSDHMPRCSNRHVTQEQFEDYQHTVTCLYYKAGLSDAVADPDRYDADKRDVMREAELDTTGSPSQKIKILQDLPYSKAASDRAHDQQAQFMTHAALYDSGNHVPGFYEHPSDIQEVLGNIGDSGDYDSDNEQCQD